MKSTPPWLFCAIVLASCRSVPAPEPAVAARVVAPVIEPEPVVTATPLPEPQADDLAAEVKRRETAILAEFSELWPTHPWAGEYVREPETRWERILVAPKAGCLAIRTSILGIKDANWGTVEMHDGKLLLSFERPNSGEAAFESKFEVYGTAVGRCLRASRAPFEGSWRVMLPANAKRELRGVESGDWSNRHPAGQSIPFTSATDLRKCYAPHLDNLAQALANDRGYPVVIPIHPEDAPDAAFAAATVLERMLPTARLTGWVLISDRDANLVLSLEDPRARDVAGYASVGLHAGSRIAFVAAIMPDTTANSMFRQFVLYRIDGTELTALMHERVFVGERKNNDKSAGWEWNITNHCEFPGVRNPLGIWSWNGDDSEFVASLQLQPGCISGLWPHTKWQDTPIAQWPHPLWVLFYWYDPR